MILITQHAAVEIPCFTHRQEWRNLPRHEWVYRRHFTLSRLDTPVEDWSDSRMVEALRSSLD
jgi:hypothetical protein